LKKLNDIRLPLTKMQKIDHRITINDNRINK